MADQDHSSRPPQAHPHPFGYTIVPPPESDLASVQGNPILDDSLRDDLNLFFDSPDNNAAAILQNPAMTAYMGNDNFTFSIDGHAIPSANANWQFSHAPFDTTASSSNFADHYGQALEQSRSNGSTSHMALYANHNQTAAAARPPPDALINFGIDVNAPDDVVEAATKLFQYTSQKNASALQSTPSDMPSQPAFHHPLPSHERRQSHHYHVPVTAPSQTYASTLYSQTNEHYRSSVDVGAAYSSPTNVSFATHRTSYPTAHPYQFGSDSNFNQNGYSGPYQHINEQSHLDFARNMGPYNGSGVASAASSHPQSPIMTRQDPQYQNQHFHSRSPVKQELPADDYSMPNPSKRRKTNAALADQEDARYAPYADRSPVINNHSSPDGNDVSPAANSQSSPDVDEDDDDDNDDNSKQTNSRKRRKSLAAQAKANAAARKNLTEEQKRENHIKSEQKRRNIIKDGYKNLNELVPNLRQGGFSKSATLTETVRELETLQEANQTSRLRVVANLGVSMDELQAMMDSL